MDQLRKQLASTRECPRLWFEKLTIFSEPSVDHILQKITFHRGLNIVWAKEPMPSLAKGTHAAGHGVGKTSLCLLLRFCLGDVSEAVAALRDELLSEYSLGGVLAVVHLNGQAFTLCRYFNAHKEGVAYEGADLNSVWNRNADYSDRIFLKRLADDIMLPVSPKFIPETGQAIEWRHLLAWLSRDQGARFKSFFAWREGEGNQLQRRRQDPPIVMRAALGLLDQGENDLLKRIAKLEDDLKKAKDRTEELVREPALIKRRIESSLRLLRKLPSDLPMRSGDLFADSVERQINTASDEAAAKLIEWESKQEKADQALADLRAQLKPTIAEFDKAKLNYEFADAARRGNEDSYRAIGAQLIKLKHLSGFCGEGNLSFEKCEHVKHEINRLELASLFDARDRNNIQTAMNESAALTVSALSRMKSVKDQVEVMQQQEKELLDIQQKTRLARKTIEVEGGRWAYLLEELERWGKISGLPESQAAINDSVEQRRNIETELSGTHTRLAVLQADKSEREKVLANLTDVLTHKLLPDGALGTFDPHDEMRPFRLSMRGGEAYRVLEVLLGDLVCLLDSTRPDSALPGFFVHDCPREADMSTGLYENFLELVDQLQEQLYSPGKVAFQYIVTTTTPPPVSLQNKAVCLILDPSSDDGLLFGRRFSVTQKEAF